LCYRSQQMRPFFIKLHAVNAVLHLPFAAVLDRALALAGLEVPAFVSLAAALALAAALHGRLQLMLRDRHVSLWRRLLVEEPYFVHWCALFLSPLLLLVVVIGGASRATTLVDLFSATSFADMWALSYLLALIPALWGVVVRRRWVRVRNLDLRVPDLPAPFDGYRIAQMSDLHVGSTCPISRVERWVRRVNGLGVDLVVLTGDYVTSGVRFHHEIATALGELRAADGVFAVMGNHDYYGEGEPLMSLLREGGVRLLRNERASIVRAGAKLCLAGVDDAYTKRIDIPATLAGYRGDAPLLALAHDPRSFAELAAGGAAIVLSGHTHWGQVAVPWLADRYNYARLIGRYHAGSYRLGDAQLYVTPGLGTTGPPLRLGTWPEIAVLTLRA